MSEQSNRLFGYNRNIAIFVVIILAAALRFYAFSGFGGLDDAEYATIAHQVTNGTFSLSGYNGPGPFPLRVGIVIPAAVSFTLLGVSQWSMVIYPFILSVGSVFLAYICAGHFFGSRAGFIAAAIWAVLPLDVYNATKLLPDLPGAFYGNIGITIILLASTREQKKLPPLFMGILAGVSLALFWLSKESITYLVLFLAILMVMTIKNDRKRNLPLWIGVAAGSFSILVAEFFIYHHYTGDWLFRLHTVEKIYRQMEDGFFTEGSRWGWSKDGSYYKALAKRLLLNGPETIFLNSVFIYMPLFGTIASLHALYWKDRAFYIPAIWLATLVLMFNFFTSSLSSYTPLALFDRYLYPICLPSIVLTAGFVEKMLLPDKNSSIQGPIRREMFFWGLVFAGFLAVTAGYQTFRNIKDIRPSANRWTSGVRTISNFLKPSDKIYTDILGIRTLKFFWRYPDRMNTTNFEGMTSFELEAGSFVIITPQYVDWLNINAGMYLSKKPGYRKPDFFNSPPPSWKVLWQDGYTTLYEVR